MKFLRTILAIMIVSLFSGGLFAQIARLDLLSNENTTILAGTTITGLLPFHVDGNVGLYPADGTNITGFDATNVSGNIYVRTGAGPAGSVWNSDVILLQAKNDLTTSYNDAAGRVPVPTGPFLNTNGGNIGGQILAPGLYKFTGQCDITGADVTLTGSATDVWIFQIATILNVGNGIEVKLAGGAQAANVFWQVGSSATIGTTAKFRGTILANISISFNTNSTLEGRAMAFSGAVTMASGTSSSKPVLILIPSPPILVSPHDTSTNVPINATFVWNASAGATSYTLQVARDSLFASMVYNTSGLTSTSQLVNGLANDTLYYWRVNATNVNGTSAWSTRWSLTTVIAAPSPPVLAVPLNIATGIATNPTLSWNSSLRAASYTLQVATDNGFLNLVYNRSGLTSTSQQITGLNNVTFYYWRVSATNAGGTSAWSTTWSFLTTALGPLAPILISPKDSSIEIPNNPTFIWNPSKGAISYTVQVWADLTFTNLVFSQSGVTSTSYQVNGLTNNSMYYWRVGAQNEGGTGWSGPWLFKTVIVAPGAPILVSPIDSTINISSPATLKWKRTPFTDRYQVQVAEDSSFNRIVFNDSLVVDTTKSVSSLNDKTRYYWKVRAQNIGGKSNWSLVRSFTTLAAIPGTPVLLSPAYSATGIATNPTLTWNASSDATTYTIQVATDNAFANLVYYQSGLTTTSQQVNGLSNSTIYYWRVNAVNVGGTSSWSTVFLFTTVTAIPIAPVLSFPANSAIVIAINPTFAWYASVGAASYTMQVASDSGFTTLIYNQGGLTLTSQQVSGLSNNKIYYWRVNSTNVSGTSSWSTVWSFTTITVAPAAPILSSPANNSTGIEFSPTLAWNASFGAASYTIQVATGDNFVNQVYYQSGLTGTSQKINGLNFNTIYYWRVNAVNPAGTSIWSTPWKFTTIPEITGAPILISPANGATITTVSPTLSWGALQGASSYTMQVSTDVGFTNLVYNQGGLTSIAQQVNGLSNNILYYWRVNAVNPAGTSSWSTVWSFRMGVAAPGVPILVSPNNSTTNNTSPVILKWKPTQNTASYQIQVSEDLNFSKIVFNDSLALDTSRTVVSLSYKTQYYWRVRSQNTGGQSAWSTVWSFKIQNGAPLAFKVVSVPNIPITSPVTPIRFSWHPSIDPDNDPVKYLLYINGNAFSKMVTDITDTSSILDIMSQLKVASNYSWYVQATDGENITKSDSGFFRTSETIIIAASIPKLNLRSNDNFVILAGSTVTGIPPVSITGNVGLSPAAGSFIVGFSGSNVNGILYVVDATGPAGSVQNATLLQTAKSDLTIAYNDAANRVPVPTGTFLNPGAGNIGGLNLIAGLYKFTAAAAITGSDLTLTGSATDVWIFQIGSSLNVGNGIKIILVGGAQAANIFWQVGTSATLGTTSVFKGTILADQSISFGTGATIDGRALAFSAAVTMGSGVIINKPVFVNVPVDPVTSNKPDQIILAQNYPNPFNPETVIEYILSKNSYVTLKVYNSLGSEIETLVQEAQTEGRYKISWHPNNLPSGLYFYKIQTEKSIEMKKMIYLR